MQTTVTLIIVFQWKNNNQSTQENFRLQDNVPHYEKLGIAAKLALDL